MSFKHFELLDEVSYDELPQTIQTKLDNFEKTFQDYDDLDENDDNDAEINELELKLETMDNGLYADLQQYIEQKNKENKKSEEEEQGVNAEPKKVEDAPAQTNSSKPSWRFW